MIEKLFNRYVRHALTALIGYVVAKGYLDEATGSLIIDKILATVTPLGAFYLVTLLSKFSDNKLVKKLKEYIY